MKQKGFGIKELTTEQSSSHSSRDMYSSVYAHQTSERHTLINFYHIRGPLDRFCKQKHIWRPATTQCGAIL